MRKFILIFLSCLIASAQAQVLEQKTPGRVPTVEVLNQTATNDGTHLNGQCLGATNYLCTTAVPSIQNFPYHTSAGGAVPGLDMIIAAGGGLDSASVYLANNGYNLDLILGYNGDFMAYSAVGQPYFTFRGGNNLASTDVDLRVQADTAVAFQFGITNSVSTRCPNIGSATILPSLSYTKCTYGFLPPAYPYVIFTATGGHTIALAQFDSSANYQKYAIGGTTPVYWMQATSTGTNQASVTLGDTNASSTLALQAGSATGLTVDQPIMLQSYTVATLPTCNSGQKGGWAYVSDATAPTYNATLTGSGTVVVPVFCNGSAWTSH